MAGFAFTLSPGKLGEMVRARYYIPLGIRLPGVAAAFFVERVLDLLAMVLLALAVFAELGDYGKVLWLAVALVIAVLAVLALVPWPRVHERLRAGPTHGWRGKACHLTSTLSSARQFLTPGILTTGLALGLIAWGLEAV